MDNKLIISAAIESVKPCNLIPGVVKLTGDSLFIRRKEYPLNLFKNIFVVGAGKASAYMAVEVEKILGNKITSGIVSTKYKHSVHCDRIKIIEAGHPVPDENSKIAGHQIFELVSKANENDLIINLISGGGSALMEKLSDGITLNDVIHVNNILLKCGANIGEINTIRKHLSLIKGGGLAKAAYPAPVISLIISDIVGDPIDLIASGPTAPNKSTMDDVLKLISKYGFEKQFPANVVTYFYEGINNEITTVPDFETKIFQRVDNFVIGNNSIALEAAKLKAEELGYHSEISDRNLTGDVRETAIHISNIVRQIQKSNQHVGKPICILFGGETTVKVTGSGLGGRNQELALLFLNEIKNPGYDYCLISCGTDGTDGPTDAAGGIASPQIYENAIQLGLSIDEFLSLNDSYNFLRQVDGLIKTGPTGTNVMDIIVVLIE